MGNVTIAPPIATNAKTGKIEPSITIRKRRIIVLKNPQAPCPLANDVIQHVNSAFTSAQRPRLSFRIGEIEMNNNTGALTLLLGEKYTAATFLAKHKPLLERGLINAGLHYHSIEQDSDFGKVVTHGKPLNQARGTPTGNNWSLDVWRNHNQWRYLHSDIKAFNKDYEFLGAPRWLKSLERLSEESCQRKTIDPPLLSSSIVITVIIGSLHCSLARVGILIYGIRYRTTLFLESDLDSICASY
jgi:hypothetical protein